MTNWSAYYPMLVWTVFLGLVAYSLAPFLASWLLWGGLIVAVIVSVVFVAMRFDLS